MSAATVSAGAAISPEQRPLRESFGRLWVYLANNRVDYLLGIVTSLGYTSGFVAVPLLIGWCIAAVEQGLGVEVIQERCLVLAAATLGAACMRFLSRYKLFQAGRQVEYEMRNDLFAHLQTLPQSFYARWRTGDLMSRCVNDLNSVRMMLGPGLLSVVQTPLMYIAVLSAMFALNWKLALLVLIPYPAFIFIARAFGRSMYGTSLGVQEGLANLSNQLQETISGMAVVKAYAMEPVTAARFDRDNVELFHRQLGFVRVMALMPAIVGLLPAFAMGIVFVVGGYEAEAGRMTLAEFYTFAMYIYGLTFPTFIMGWVFSLVQRGAAAMQRLDELLSVEPSIADRDDVLPVETLHGEIEFRGLTFRYDADREAAALSDLNLHVPAGSTLGIVGPVGSGKTTLASMIPRLFEVEDGTVLLDGVDVNRIPLRTLRQSVAMVPQDSFLFSMTLADNVAFGVPEASLDAVEEAARRAQLAKDVEDLPEGYGTVVGERGVMLSGGQRQRTALARALLLRPKILILDDTLSAVDAETEAAIQAELNEVFEGRTVVVIAHRISSVKHCDQIIVLEEGRIVERGSHAELAAQGGLYARLVRDQEMEEALEHLGDEIA